MEIQPATLAQVVRGRGGKMVQIDDDVAGIAQRLQEIDPRLRLRYSEPGGYFVVYRLIERPDGSTKKDMVTTSTTVDGRLLQRIEKVYGRDYNYADELDKVDAAAKRERDHRFSEQVGPLAEQLAHAIRKDLGVKAPRIYVPREV